jgi:hypothetical protein
VAQDRQRAQRAAQVRPAGREGSAGRNLQRRGPEHADKAVKAFAADYGAKWPKTAATITDDVDVLVAFYDYPAEHWIHLHTTNPIESTCATVRLRQRVTKGPGSRAAGVAMAFKLMESAQHRWRAVNSPHLVALVRAGARFNKGKLVERPDTSGGEEQSRVTRQSTGLDNCTLAATRTIGGPGVASRRALRATHDRGAIPLQMVALVACLALECPVVLPVLANC